MKKLIGIVALLGFVFVLPGALMAQDAAVTEEVVSNEGGITLMKRYFIEGGWEFMSIILVCLILGLAFCIERIITLSLADINADKLLSNVEKALTNKDVEKAKSICKSTRGPIASIMYQGLTRTNEGIDIVEKSVASYGSVQMGQLEKGLSWISLFIALAPMLGFFGTVIGMVQAFDDIANAGAISATIVAGGIKVALLTTVFGLIVAIILQVFYNFISSKIEGIVNKMEDSSITFIDILVKNKIA
ncbi:MAG: MotA/TolQ/ExbB proton channel family protein [Chitinophagales bacterium]